jgi:signal transduction histidine kinase
MNLRRVAHRVRSMRTVDAGVTVLLVVAVYSVGMLSILNGRFPGLLLPIGALVLTWWWPLLGTTSAAALAVGIAGSATSGNEIAYAASAMTICSYLAVRTVPGWGAVIPGSIGVVTCLLTGSPDLVAATALAALVGGGAAAMQGLTSRTEASETLVARLRARTQEQERRQAWLSERAELARDLHDIVGHHVTAMVVSAEAAKVQGADEHTLDTIADLGRSALTELDTLVGSLREAGTGPTTRATPRLSDLPSLMEPLRSSGVAVDFESVLTSPLTESTELAIYRIVQEATTNILKHAHATSARVDVIQAGGAVTVRVSDDGCGIGADDPTGRVGRGLIGIGERVEALGGSWTYDAGPGEGAILTAVLPVGDVP